MVRSVPIPAPTCLNSLSQWAPKIHWHHFKCPLQICTGDLCLYAPKAALRLYPPSPHRSFMNTLSCTDPAELPWNWEFPPRLLGPMHKLCSGFPVFIKTPSQTIPFHPTKLCKRHLEGRRGKREFRTKEKHREKVVLT